MLDLNLTFANQDNQSTTLFRDVEESGTSNSSLVNADGVNSSNAGEVSGDGDDDSTSVAGESFPCFSFDILTVGDTNLTRSESTQSELVTRHLFPVSQRQQQYQQQYQQQQQQQQQVVNSLFLCPNSNDQSQEMKLVEVQPQKHNVQPQPQVGKKSRRGPRSRSSQYRGVTFYRRTGRWESHIWDCGKQVYLGGFDTAHAAARAYDRAAIKFRGVDADINFSINDYEEDMKQMKDFSKEEFVHILRRQSTGFSRGTSKYRGVTLHKCGRWEARMGQFLGKKYIYLGLFDSEADAARAYDKAAIECNGREAMTNFEASTYEGKTYPTVNHGNDHNLNLSLGISSSVGAGSSSKENSERPHLKYVHNTRLQLDNSVSSTALKGLPLNSGPTPSWNGVYPTFVPNYECSTNSNAIAGPSQGPPNWGWQVHGHNHNHIPVAAAAASSGFSAPVATSIMTSGASHHSRDNNISLMALNNHYSPPMAAAASSSQYYYHQIRPPPPPP